MHEPQNAGEFISWLNKQIARLEVHANANDLESLAYLETWRAAHCWATDNLSQLDAEVLEPAPEVYPRVPGWAAIVRLKRLRDRLTGEQTPPARGKTTAGQGNGAGASRVQAGPGQAKSKATKKRLGESQREPDKLKLQVYTFIHDQHAAGRKPLAILAALKASQDRMEQVKKAGLKASKALVWAALAYFGQPRFKQARKKQDSPPA